MVERYNPLAAHAVSKTKGGTIMPGKRIPPSQAVNNEIMNLINNLSEHTNNQETFGKLVELSMRKMIQELLRERSPRAYRSRILRTRDESTRISQWVRRRYAKDRRESNADKKAASSRKPRSIPVKTVAGCQRANQAIRKNGR